MLSGHVDMLWGYQEELWADPARHQHHILETHLRS